MTRLAADRVVLLTPEGRGAVASLRVEGPRAEEWIQRHFVGAKAPFMPGRIRIGHWGTGHRGTGESGTPPPEEVVVCRLEPEQFEVHCHGGDAASRRIVADLVQDGCATVAWRRWVGFQESDPIRAGARLLLADAQTERTAAILLDQFNGALQRAIDEVVAALESADAPSAVARLDLLLARAEVALHLVEPWRVVLAGPPNAGKSSLINALVGYRRSIVHDRPGTTRDAVSVGTVFDGWPVELIDTAGLRISDDRLESAGIDRSRQQCAAADVVLLVFDAAQPWTAELAAMARQIPKAIVVHNKIDLLRARDAGDSHTAADRPPGIATSALDGSGLKPLLAQLIGRLIGIEPPTGAAVPFAASQLALLHEAKGHVDRREWNAATVAMRAMTEPGHDSQADSHAD
jgi:tRNA modification GTPase